MMASNLIWEEEAIDDRADYFEWLYQQNPKAAEDADQYIEDTVDLLIENPFLGKDSVWRESSHHQGPIVKCVLSRRPWNSKSSTSSPSITKHSKTHLRQRNLPQRGRKKQLKKCFNNVFCFLDRRQSQSTPL